MIHKGILFKKTYKRFIIVVTISPFIQSVHFKSIPANVSETVDNIGKCFKQKLNGFEVTSFDVCSFFL